MKMDTKSLVVGQKVWMRSGDERTEGMVKRADTTHIEVEIDPNIVGRDSVLIVKDGAGTHHEILGSPGSLFLCFDRNGKQFDGYVYQTDCFGLVNLLCGKSGEPWQLSGKRPLQSFR